MEIVLAGDSFYLSVYDAVEYVHTSYPDFMDKISFNRDLRIGQVWFNMLDEKDQNKLRGSLYDPFHKNAFASVLYALAYLLNS